MKIDVRFAKALDKKKFLELALERDKSIKMRPRKAYWQKKFVKLVGEKRLIIGFVGKKPAGFLYFTFNFIDYSCPYIERVFVGSSSRRLGIARKLFEKAEQLAKEKRFPKIFSSTNPDNKISLSMHRNFGYRRRGHIDGIERPRSREIFLCKSLKK